MTPAEKILPRLEGVRRTGGDQYTARCPSHDDKTPSLSIRDRGDLILLHCHAGCEKSEIMEAMGLTLADLYDRPLDHHQHPIPAYKRWDYRALLRQLHAEASVILLAANDLGNGKALSPVDRERLRKAIGRITKITELAG